MLPIFKPKRPTGFHDQLCPSSMDIPIAPVLFKPGKWIRWIPPDFGLVKLNTDGSCIQGIAAGGGIARDHNGSVLLSFSNNYGQATSMEAETKALLDGLMVCSQHGINIHTIEMDSHTLFSILQGDFKVPWRITYLVRKCKALLNAEMTIQHVYREGNRAADHMASVGHSISTLTIFSSLGSRPLECKKICIEDMNGLYSFRKH